MLGKKKQLILEKERVCNLIPKIVYLEMDFCPFIFPHSSHEKSGLILHHFPQVPHSEPVCVGGGVTVRSTSAQLPAATPRLSHPRLTCISGMVLGCLTVPVTGGKRFCWISQRCWSTWNRRRKTGPKRVEVTNDVTYTCHMPRKKCNLKNSIVTYLYTYIPGSLPKA